MRCSPRTWRASASAPRRALEACGYSALLVHSGSLLPVFQDDHTYPFKVHAPFKVWAPLLEVPDCFLYFEPGRRPLLAFHQPEDYWYKPPALPQGYWTRALRDSSLPRPGRGAPGCCPPACGPPPFSAMRSAGARLLGRRPTSTRPISSGTSTSPVPPSRPTSSPACARRAVWGARGHARRRRAPSRPAPRNSRSSWPSSPPAASASRSCPTTPSSPSTRAAPSCTTSCCESPGRRSISLLIDAGAEFAGYASDITRTLSPIATATSRP